MGYISLRTQLQADEVLGVAFSFIYNGKTYQVGEFSTDNKENTSDCIYVKLLKGITMSPDMMFWDLMMNYPEWAALVTVDDEERILIGCLFGAERKV